MNIKNHINNLKEYINNDIIYNNPKSIKSDFDQFCYNHCEDIKIVLEELERLLIKEKTKWK